MNSTAPEFIGGYETSSGFENAMSVPPAVAGGYIGLSSRIDIGLRHPPATAGGTDRIALVDVGHET
jgi:hypothetical protein